MNISVNVKETGTQEAINKLSSFIRLYPREVAGGLKEEGELTMTESKKECPVDTGALRSSGHVEAPIISGEKISVKLGYGGIATKINPKSGLPTTSYAIKVHEELGVHHKVGKAKYLEDPIKRRRMMIWQNINASVTRALRRSGIV
jgi:hypothetical protein